LSFIGQFLRIFLQLGLSAANAVVQSTAANIETTILEYFRMELLSTRPIDTASRNFLKEINRFLGAVFRLARTYFL